MSISLSPIVQRARARAHFGVLSGALELLESHDFIARSAGIYALESLAREDENARQSVRDVLSALVRRRAGRAHLQIGARDAFGAACIEAGARGGVANDVQAALSVLGRLARASDGAPLDLHGISLRGAFLPGARLAGALLYSCDLEGALLEGADLRGAWLWQTNLERVNLDDADLRGADLSSARGLTRAQIEAARCDETTRLPTLSGANAARPRWQPR